MKLIRFVGSSVFQILSVFFVLALLLGVLNIHFSDKTNYCVMTYMYEYPQYVRVSVPANTIYPQYGLYAYSEGRITEFARKMWFDGVPVLFLPGNSGSHKESRSLASVALRMGLHGPTEYHLDYFTIDYNEELSGLYGGVLESQIQFAAACIDRILSLYKPNKYTQNVPSTVILIGHSMGGVIAKRLLAYPATINTTRLAITLAAPLEAPVVNFDNVMNDFYMQMNQEWKELDKNTKKRQRKTLLSFGSGPRDFLIPSGLTSSKDSYISALTTSIPGVWVSAGHVHIVWCKQVVMAINKFLFDIVDQRTEQLTNNMQELTSKARQYFQANRSMTLSPEIIRPNVSMIADAFWYEDNRRIYQIARPAVDRVTYLMIRLTHFPQNRFVAVETVNVSDKDWVFGCNAMHVHHTYRYCKQATSLTELSRWTAAALDFGKRKLATVDLHSIRERHPDWSHVVVKVSPTRKPIILNVDINDYHSRRITVEPVSVLSFGRTIIKQETELNSLYYELVLLGFNAVYQAHLLHVEPTASCKATQYHVSAEVHIPWAKNHEYYHFFTHLKRSPMKLRLYKSDPNATYGLESREHVKVTLLLDPQCTFTISISTSWYHRLAQITRHYSPVLVSYMAAILLLATRSNVLSLKEHGKCMTIHGALMSEGVKPYYVLVSARLGFMAIMSTPLLTYIFENASWTNIELIQFSRSLLVLPAYMTALGILHLTAAAVLGVMVFCSQLAHRLFFRIVWRGGGTTMAEKVASGLQRMPYIVIVVLVAGVPLSCGAASLVAGAAFYAFILSKMYEEYLEDYVYKFMAKVASKICRLLTTKRNSNTVSESTNVVVREAIQEPTEIKAIEDKTDKEKETKEIVEINEMYKENEKKEDDMIDTTSQDDTKQIVPTTDQHVDVSKNKNDENAPQCESVNSENVDDELNNLNFHMMMFSLWMFVTLVNVPALLTWARNFKYSMVLKPDTSYNVGLIMSVCSAFLWQINGPRKHLKHYDTVAALLFIMAVCIIVLGPFSLSIVNYGVTLMYVTLTFQQMCDKLQNDDSNDNVDDSNSTNFTNKNSKSENVSNDNKSKGSEDASKEQQDSEESTEGQKDASGSSKSNDSGNISGTSDDCVCNENRIYSMFRNLRDKFDFSGDES